MDDLDRAFAPPPEGSRQNSVTSSDGWNLTIPIPADVPKPTVAQICEVLPPNYGADGYKFSKAWSYRNADDRAAGFIVRLDRPANGRPAEKVFLPVTYWTRPNGKGRFRCKGFPEPRLLYGANLLAERVDAPVLVLEGEKTTDAAREKFPQFVCVSSPGGSNGARKADWSALRGRDVLIFRDNDQPGEGYARDVAEMAFAAGAETVRQVAIPAGLPVAWDVADPLPETVAWSDIEVVVRDAVPVGRPAPDGPVPLFQPLAAAEPFPTAMLGPLAAAAEALARKVQVPAAIAGQSVLAAASLACQAHADVRLPFGQARPLSLFFVTVAASGDRKTTTDNDALWPVTRHEKNLREIHSEAMKTWRVAHAAWQAEKRKIESGKGTFADRKDKLIALGEEPEKPLAPFIITGDLTPDGLTKHWLDMHPALGVFTAEGGTFTNSHGMNDDNRLRTAAMLSSLWDGAPVKRLRAGDGPSILVGRRLAMHILVQPDVAASFLSDKTLRDQGLLSRVLVSAPASIAGTRFYKEPTAEDEATIRAYGARILSILETAAVMADGKRNELDPPELTISAQATVIWKNFFDHVEHMVGSQEDVRGVQDFAAKAAEHAGRIAGVLTLYDDVRAREIGAEMMGRAVELTSYYVGEVLRLHAAGQADPKLVQAHKLLEWLRGVGPGPISFRDIVRLGPGALRTKAAADAALGILKAHGWIEEVNARPRSIRLVVGA